MIPEKYLPLGTIVLLKEASKKMMIIGYCPVTQDNKMFDYSGCLWPEGVIGSDKSLLFNHDQIGQIFSEGFKNEETIEFNNKIKELVVKMQTEQQANNVQV